jgi:sulfur relay (sulfurtransferase) complex TusBCD TusD component (DsrE family)
LWNSSLIVEEVERTRNKTEIVVRYHFESEKPDKHNLRGLLASLVSQLCKSSKRPPEFILTKCRDGSNPPSEAELTQHLNDVLAELKKTQSSIFIVIDGVDKCMETKSADSPRKKVLKFLEGLVRTRHSNLYICITSSLKEGMEKNLKQMAAGPSSRQVILHDQDGQKEDIKTYIAAFVRTNMSEWPDIKKDEVIKKLSEQAGGM